MEPFLPATEANMQLLSFGQLSNLPVAVHQKGRTFWKQTSCTSLHTQQSANTAHCYSERKSVQLTKTGRMELCNISTAPATAFCQHCSSDCRMAATSCQRNNNNHRHCKKWQNREKKVENRYKDRNGGGGGVSRKELNKMEWNTAICTVCSYSMSLLQQSTSAAHSTFHQYVTYFAFRHKKKISQPNSQPDKVEFVSL